MRLEGGTFIVLEFAEPFASHVVELRRSCGDAFRASLPAEITVAGSSGLGSPVAGQALDHVEDEMSRLAARIAPIHGEFGPMLRFPGTDLFVFTVNDETPFRSLHRQFATSGLAFESSPFPFKPHCTISGNRVTADEARRRLELTLPGRFLLPTLALYGLRDGQPIRLTSRAFTGQTHSKLG
jgi:2'-5' RNA ligase